MLNKKFLKFILFLAFSLFLSEECFSQDFSLDVWSELKGKHFVVMYAKGGKPYEAKLILKRAEKYYGGIAKKIGYKRYNQFWTWDQRVRIFIYSDKATYLLRTGKPDWSNGYAERMNSEYKSRAIVTYWQDKDFIEGVLPHEIGHLILRDFVGSKSKIPSWFDEGVAQLQEKKKLFESNYIMKFLIENDSFIPFNGFMSLDVRSEKEELNAAIFYSQSVSVVNFMILEYGSKSFGRLCSHIKDGKSFSEAFENVYSSKTGPMEMFEKKWLSYMESY